jgi:o-succinylbenzoate---CoA ligase
MLRVVEAAYGPELVAALEAALAGGPAVLPVPAGAAGQRLLAALRPDLPAPEGVALVVPTSGSTGEPKGVELTAAALAASAAATEARIGAGRWLLALPVTHVAGLQVVLRALRAGAPPVTGELVEATRRHRPDYVSLVPTQLRRFLGSAAATGALASYRAVLLGGAAAAPALVRRARDAGVPVVTTYGMSETCGGCVYDGVPLDGVSVGIEAGRIALAGPVVARGYRFGPGFPGGRFRTGDLGTWDGQRLTVLGRADDVVNTGGEKVAPAAVEAALAEHPAVVDAAVVGVPDEEWGERVVAVVVLSGPLSVDDARAFVAARVSAAAAPRELRVVDALPLLPSGKLDRAALR